MRFVSLPQLNFNSSQNIKFLLIDMLADKKDIVEHIEQHVMDINDFVLKHRYI